jgi:hypothetical protein
MPRCQFLPTNDILKLLKCEKDWSVKSFLRSRFPLIGKMKRNFEFLIILILSCRSARDECEYLNDRSALSKGTCLLYSILYKNSNEAGDSKAQLLWSQTLFQCGISFLKANNRRKKSKYQIDP